MDTQKTKILEILTNAFPISGISCGKDLSNSAQLPWLSTATGVHLSLMGEQGQVIVARRDLYNWNIF